MNVRSWILGALLLAIPACASEATTEPVESDIVTASDSAIQGKLRGILKDVTFTSESDYGYQVIEGETAADRSKRLSTAVVRQKLAAVVKAKSSDHRDILPTSCRAERLNVSSAIAEGESAQVPSPDDDNYTYARHDKQLMIALKYMRQQLKGVVGYTFGTDASGNQDELGTVVFVYVGISKTTGKLIAIMTEAVWT